MNFITSSSRKAYAIVCILAVTMSCFTPFGSGKVSAAVKATGETASIAAKATTKPKATAKPKATTKPKATAKPKATPTPTPKPADTVDVRMVFTTDLHGRLTTYDYELNKELRTGSLAKAYTLIKAAREEKPSGNTFTFDLGDVLYDYTTESIFELEPTAIQPIYKAMAKLGYDAIVLGNHEFDYGYDYMVKQIQGAGLDDICVVSNLKNSKTKKTVFNENMLISKKLTTKDGKKVTVKVGVIGETVPVLSKKRENYIGKLVTEDIVANATEQAKKLKEQGADLIVVLAHSGMGSEEPTEFSKDAAYALTKIPEVDVVLAGHAHKQFPSSASASSSYYKLSGVDSQTGLVNGKNLIMANDRGQSIGVADLTLELGSKEKKIVKRSSQVRNVTVETEADASVNNSFGKWQSYFNEKATNVVGNVEQGKELENYFGLVEDSNAIQLLNNAKINYALKTLSGNASYENYPIVAASNYNRYGQLSADDFISITGEMTEGNLSAIAPFNKYVFLYEVTGHQIKEWLEWSASAYETTTEEVQWSDENMNVMMKQTGLKSLVSEEWLDEWGSFYVFDGISYTIDPSVEPRYNYYGEKISKTSRIKEITYNGVPVTDAMKFVLATEPLTGTKIDVLKGMEGNFIVKGITTNITVLMDYVRQLSAMGDVVPVKDSNWKLDLPASYNYIVKASTDVELDSSQHPWFQSKIGVVDQYTFYKGKGIGSAQDVYGPNLVVASTNEKPTNQNVKIAVRATDQSPISKLVYMQGEIEESVIKNGGTSLIDHSFTAYNNGIYTIYAEDQHGNGTIEYINISNISSSILQVPTIKSYTNRMSSITGTAEKGATVHFITDNGGSYETQVGSDGKFTYALPSQPAGTRVTIYVSDDAGRSSDKITLITKRTGANQPYMDEINNSQQVVRGKTNDKETDIFIQAGDVVYVSKDGGVEAYQACDKFNDKKTVVATDISIDASGNFTVKVQPIADETIVWAFGLDSAGRGSKGFQRTVTYVGPNAPVLYPVCDIENKILGRVPQMKKDGVTGVVLTVGSDKYDLKPDSKGYFSLDEILLTADTPISVYVKGRGAVDGSTGNSAVIQSTVRKVEDFMEVEFDPFLKLDEVDNKSMDITGRYDGDPDDKLILSIDGTIVPIELDADGEFVIALEGRINAGKKIVAMARQEYGDIRETSVQTVKVGKPDLPEVLNKEVYNTTKKVQVAATEKGRIEIHAGKKKYTSKESTYNEETKKYVFTVEIETCEPGDILKVYAFNSAGSSDAVEITVVEKVVEEPEENTEGNKKENTKEEKN